MEKILAELSTCTSEEVTFGKTKIFIKSPKTVSWSVTCIRWGRVGELICMRGWVGKGASITWNG